MNERYARPLTPDEITRVEDADIDTSDIPEYPEGFWAGAELSPPRTKPNISLRVPHEVVEYFKAETPKGYTSRMAAVLTAYVRARRPE